MRRPFLDNSSTTPLFSKSFKMRGGNLGLDFALSNRAMLQRSYAMRCGHVDEEAIFAAALDRRDPSERAALLKEMCGENAELRARIETLLNAEGSKNTDEP